MGLLVLLIFNVFIILNLFVVFSLLYHLDSWKKISLPSITLPFTLALPPVYYSHNVCFHLMKAITDDQLRDDEEYEEILEDMKDECSKFGTLMD